MNGLCIALDLAIRWIEPGKGSLEACKYGQSG